MAITVKEAQTLYVSYFGRPADVEGLKYWTGSETVVGSLGQLAHSFFNSAEGKKYYPVDPATNQIDITGSINAIYANMFGRAPETAGFNYWYNEIASGKVNLAEAAVAIYKGALGKDAVMIENKIAAATQFTDQVAASGKSSSYYGDQAFAKANEFLKTVTDTTDVTSADFAAQVNAAVEATVGPSPDVPPSEGGTFMLTAGVDVASTNVAYHGNMQNPDTFRFTDANETIEATTLTLGSGDNFTDGNDKDKDVLHIALQNYDVSKTIGTGSGEVGNGVTISGIEVLDIDATAGGANTITYKGGFTSITDLIIRGAFDGAGTGLNVDVSSDSALKTVDLTGVSYAGGKGLVFTGSGSTNDLTISGPSFNASITGGNGNDTITGQGTINGGSGNDVITGKGSINGDAGNDTITATGLSTIKGGDGNDTISGYGSIEGGSGNDIITLTDTATVVGGSGIDTITTSTTGVVTFKNTKGDTATISSTANVKVGDIYKEVVGAAVNADTYTVKVGDKIDISGAVLGSGGNLLNGGNAYSATEKVAVTASSGTGDVFLLKNGADYFLVYEASGSGDTASLGSGAEVIKLVGLTADNKITLEGGIVTIA